MTAEKLAYKGGPKSITLPFPPHPVVGVEERVAVDRVFARNQFSQFIASAGKNFLGGIEVQEFEKTVSKSVECEYGVAYNSWTSGLHAAVAACGVQAGDGVFVTPYTFTSSATCALMNNCAPIFVDVDPKTCLITPETLQNAINQHPDVKVLVVVHLFGLPADMDPIMEICQKHEIRVIEDAAQAPGSTYKGRQIGSIGDCGGFSFTESKSVMSGEGGVLVTNDNHIATRAQMVRNHGEAVTGLAENRTYNSEILGMGYRITELAAAIGTEQWKKLPLFNAERIRLNEEFKDFIRSKCDFIDFQEAPYNCQHVYYVTPMLFNADKAGIPRDTFADAVTAEGLNVFKGYVKPLYMQDLYQNRNHHALRELRPDVSYSPGICPNAEKLYKDKLFFIMSLRPIMNDDLFGQIKGAFSKVIDNIDQLR